MAESVSYKELDSPQGKLWNAKCSPEIYDEGFVKLGATEGLFPRSYVSFYDRIKKFAVRSDDVWVVSFPKCGTTWTQEMVWLLMNDLDYEKAKVDINARAPYFELRANWTPKLMSKIINNVLQKDPNAALTEEEKNKCFFLDSFSAVEDLTSPRCIKSHLHYSLLPDEIKTVKPKIIYVTRNPKAACVSYYHHNCLLDGFSGSLSEFVECFISDNMYCGPYWTHLREFWEIRNDPNVLFLTYEEMKKDLPAVIRKTATFLNKSVEDSQLKELTEHLSFENMKNNPAVNYSGVVEGLRKIHGRTHDSQFMRKGLIDSWTDELTPDMIRKFDEWSASNKIEGLY